VIPQPWPILAIQPQIRAFAKLPLDNGTLAVQSILYHYQDNGDLYYVVMDLVMKSYLNNGGRTAVLTHGFLNDINTDWLTKGAYALLESDPDISVVVVGWGGGANIGAQNYPQAVANTKSVAQYMAQLFSYLETLQNYIQCVGHSLGAHICGQAGRIKFESDNTAIDYIVGLDPAGPLINDHLEYRLAPENGKFVECVHTDIGTFSFGTNIPAGHADFYPNAYEVVQPGCGVDVACSHGRATELFYYTLLPHEPCTSMQVCYDYHRLPESCNQTDTLILMLQGDHTNKGHFYLKTTDRPPYCSYSKHP